MLFEVQNERQEVSPCHRFSITDSRLPSIQHLKGRGYGTVQPDVTNCQEHDILQGCILIDNERDVNFSVRHRTCLEIGIGNIPADGCSNVSFELRL